MESAFRQTVSGQQSASSGSGLDAGPLLHFDSVGDEGTGASASSGSGLVPPEAAAPLAVAALPAAAASVRILARRGSGPDEDAAETIATDTSKEFDAGRIYSECATDSTVAFWANTMSSHLTALRAKNSEQGLDHFCDNLSPYARDYYAFVATRLLEVAWVGSPSASK